MARKSRHGGVSTQIVTKETRPSIKAPEKRPRPEPQPQTGLKKVKAGDKASGGIIRKVFGMGRT